MKKYCEIELNDDDKKILSILKKIGFTHIAMDISDDLAIRMRRNDLESCSMNMKWFKGFDWMDYGDSYEIDKLLNPPHEPKTVWELKEGDEYWSVSAAGIVYKETCNNSCPDIDCRSQGNAFLTEEDAKFEAKRREVVTKVRKYTIPFEYGFDNCSPYWDCDSHKIRTFHEEKSKSPVDYFDSWDDIQKAIDEVGEEDFKKYYLGVTE